MNKIETIVKSDLCAGCGLCEATDDRVEMRYDSRGFLRPSGISDISDESAAKIERMCPAINGLHVGRPREPRLSTDAMWGPYKSIYVGHSLNANVRHLGSSGGVLTEICTYLLDSKEVDAVLVTGTDPCDPLRTMPILATSSDQILKAAGSKYSASSPLSLLDKILEYPGSVAFVGKPCDAAGMRLAMKEYPELQSKVKYVLSFFCAGVPSDLANAKIVDMMGMRRTDVVDFWHRGKGWPGNTTAIDSRGQRGEMSYNDAWGRVLSKQLQTRCKLCADGVGEAADIVAGDAWECDTEGYPTFAEQDGRSLIMARSSSGSALLDSMKIARRISTEDLSASEIGAMQPGQLKRRRELKARMLAMNVMGVPSPHYPPDALDAFSLGLPVKARVRTFLGTIWRLAKLRLNRK